MEPRVLQEHNERGDGGTQAAHETRKADPVLPAIETTRERIKSLPVNPSIEGAPYLSVIDRAEFDGIRLQ